LVGIKFQYRFKIFGESNQNPIPFSSRAMSKHDVANNQNKGIHFNQQQQQ
jgi:hypothetical protein